MSTLSSNESPTHAPATISPETAQTQVWKGKFGRDYYRSHSGLLWKMDYAQRYQQRFQDLELVRERHLPSLEGSNVDTEFSSWEKKAGWLADTLPLIHQGG